MKLKSILLTAVATISLATATMAQNVPNYVPTNGLIGWWPFNGNANDESANGNNGTVNGAVLANDRFAIPNACYDFNGSGNYISVPDNGTLLLTNTDFSFNAWVLPSNTTSNHIFYKGQSAGDNFPKYMFTINNNRYAFHINGPGLSTGVWKYSNSIAVLSWQMVTVVKSGGQIYFYKNGVLDTQSVFNNTITNTTGIPVRIGGAEPNGTGWWNGKIDDIGMWNRALTQQEITDLYNAVNCANNTSITPQSNSLISGSAATFTASTTDPNPSYVWQSDFGQGFQALNNFGNYSGVNTATLNIANVQLPNHTQPIRVISTSGNCIDTSNVAVINILDTCLVTVYDTLLTTVTDTLVINTQITGTNPPNNLNTLKVFPNPASTHITIDYGNFNAMNGYTLKIVNSVGQTVFTTQINQQTSYIDLSTWTGNGIYFVQLIDPQNNTIENRKIVIQ